MFWPVGRGPRSPAPAVPPPSPRFASAREAAGVGASDGRPMVDELLDEHLNRIYGELGEGTRTAELLFKVLAERDAKGRLIRKPTEWRTVRSVCAASELLGASIARTS